MTKLYIRDPVVLQYITCVVTCASLCFRLHEFDEQVQCVREGMARVVPVPLLSLFTGFELETMVCTLLANAHTGVVPSFNDSHERGAQIILYSVLPQMYSVLYNLTVYCLFCA